MKTEDKMWTESTMTEDTLREAYRLIEKMPKPMITPDTQIYANLDIHAMCQDDIKKIESQCERDVLWNEAFEGLDGEIHLFTPSKLPNLLMSVPQFKPPDREKFR